MKALENIEFYILAISIVVPSIGIVCVSWRNVATPLVKFGCLLPVIVVVAPWYKLISDPNSLYQRPEIGELTPGSSEITCQVINIFYIVGPQTLPEASFHM